MPKHNDEALVAYLDGELDDTERQHVDAWLEADPAVRERLAALAQSADLVREAYAEIVAEPVPERLIAAARAAGSPTPEAEILVLRRRRPQRGSAPPNPGGRQRFGAVARMAAVAAAAGLFGILVGGAGTYLGLGVLVPAQAPAEHQLAAEANDIGLDNAAGYYKLTVNAGDSMLIDVPASNDTSAALQKISQSLPQQVRLPDLKPWGLAFRGARLAVAGGRPAAELVYVTDNKAIGPLTLLIGASKLPDIAPTVDHRDGVNLVYWRHHERAYTLAGRADNGYLWGIANDVAWQLDAI